MNNTFAKIFFTHWLWVCLLIWYGLEQLPPQLFKIVAQDNGILLVIIGVIYLVLSTTYCIYALSKRNLNASAALLWTVGFFILPAITGPLLFWLYLHRSDSGGASA